MHHKLHNKRQRSMGPPASLSASGSGSQQDAFWLAHMHALEKHFRENKLRLTFADELGRAEKEVRPKSVRESVLGLCNDIPWRLPYGMAPWSP